MDTDPDFATGVALVTGGSGGLGRAVCLRLAEAGSDIALTYHRNAAAAEEVADEVRSLGRRATAMALDAADEASARACVEDAAKEYDGLHTVVYASGPDLPLIHISNTSPAQFRDFMLQDAVGFYNLIHPAIPHLRASQGSVVALLTAALKRYAKRDIHSVAPKAAVEAVIHGIAREEGRYGVRANGIGVGGVQAGMHWRLRQAGIYNEETLEVMRRNRSLPYAGEARDIAEAVLYLASRRTSRYITGQTIIADGGFSI